MLRPATESDVDAIRRWRNHPEVRKQFIHTDVIDPVHHRAWWERVSADPGAQVLIFLDRDEPSGVVTITGHDRDAATAEWGFFLDIDGLRERGRLFPAWVALEREAIAYAFGELGVGVLGGRTLATNSAVLMLHERHGFRAVSERGYRTTAGGQRCDVVWMELRSFPPTLGDGITASVGRTT